jgi:hypothetical protein
MKRILFIATLSVFVAGLITNASLALAGEPDHKVVICHIPPGNPGNAHEIDVDVSAVPAHMSHGDYIGVCVVPLPEPL